MKYQAEEIKVKRLTWLKNFAYLFVFMALVWLGLTRSFSWQELSVGLGVSFIVSLVIARSYGKLGLPPLGAQAPGLRTNLSVCPCQRDNQSQYRRRLPSDPPRSSDKSRHS